MTDSNNRMPDSEQAEQFFFIHIQKTAGTSLRQHLLENFRQEEIYPLPQKGGLLNYLVLYEMGGLLVGLPPEEQAAFRLFHGHMPFAVTRRLTGDKPPTTFTVLREPVARTLSVLKQKKRKRPELADASLEDIYNIPKYFEGQILNHQAKVFAVPDDSDLLSGFDPYPIGPAELETAKQNLAKVDVIGLQSDMPAFLTELERRFGWRMLQEDVRENVSKDMDVPQSLIERIKADNAVDIAFYEFAQQLVKKHAAQQ